MYRCQICQVTSEPGQPQLRHPVYYPGTKQIEREIAVCPGCSAPLARGESLESVKNRLGRAILPVTAPLPTRIPDPAPSVALDEPVAFSGRVVSARNGPRLFARKPRK